MKHGLLFCNVVLLTILFGALANKDVDHSSYRLPDNIVPISYDLWLFPRLAFNDFTYQGYVNITLNVHKVTDTIILHNNGLLIRESKTALDRGAKHEIPRILSQSYDKEKQFYIIRFHSKLSVGVYTLLLHFEGEVRDDVFGFYRSSYVDGGKTKWMGVTQFSPTHARRAFPCMDEPHLKAVFTLHIGHAKNETVTCNSEANSTVQHSNIKDYYVTTFQPTPKMSTYLVGWAVHDFVSETSAFSDKMKIWTRRSMKHCGTVSLNQGYSIYEFLKNYLLIENPISKLDIIAVTDFNFNAMENWGMITFRESVVLYDGGVTPTKKMIDGLAVMAHEYAHTWFGNLVTPKFWNFAWLKEGFATYFQYFAVSKVQSPWDMMSKFVVSEMQPTLIDDSANHTRTMNGQNVGDHNSVMATLDFVSYKKGASVIRMLSHAIGESAFQSGLQSYLKAMSYKAASPSDVYYYLQLSSNKVGQLQHGLLIKDIMATWTDQPGFPLVNVTRDYNKLEVVISQEQFRCYSLKPNQPSSSKWWIPLNYATKSDKNFTHTTASHWLTPKKNITLEKKVPSHEWIIFNIQQIGYYRVNYDEKNWRLLIDHLRTKNFKDIHSVNRATLIDDAFNLARAGYLSYSIAFDLSKYLIQETEYEPWMAATRCFKFLNKMLSNVPNIQRSFQKHVISLLQPMYKKLGFNESLNEDLRTKLCREPILSTSCLLGDTNCSRTSESQFKSWITASDKSISKDVKSVVYCEGIRTANHTIWQKMFDIWQSTDLHTEQELLLKGLGCTQDVNLINRYLEVSISEEKSVRKQYRITIINAILDGDVRNVQHVLEFVRNNWRRIIDLRGADFFGKMLTAIGNAITTSQQVRKLHVFVDDYSKEFESVSKSALKAIDTATETVEWIQHFTPKIAQYFK